jgi:phage protein D
LRNAPFIRVYVKPEGQPDIINMSHRVLAMSYEDSDTKADRLRLTIDNQDLKNFDTPIWSTGNTLFVTWGYPEAYTQFRKTVIKRVVGFTSLTVESRGGELLLNSAPAVRAWENISHSGVAKKIAEFWGFRDEERLQHIEDTEVVFPVVQQTGQTDAQFINSLATKHGFVWYIDSDGFHFHRRQFLQPTIKRFEYNSTRAQTEILEINVESDATRRLPSVSMAGYDPVDHKPIYFNAENWSDEKKQALAQWLNSPDMKEYGEWNIKGFDHPLGTPPDTAAAEATAEENKKMLQQRAEAQLRKHQHYAIEMKMTIVGDPLLQAKHIIALDGVGAALSQRYYIKTITHAISSAGYTCELEMITDGIGGKVLDYSIAIESGAVPKLVPNAGKRFPDDPKAPAADPEHPPLRVMPSKVELPAVEIQKPKVELPGLEIESEPHAKAIRPGNIDLTHRPYVLNIDGTVSTVRSITVSFDERGADGKLVRLYYLLPTVSDDGRIMTTKQAITTFRQTDRHLGAYATQEAADDAGEAIHRQQEDNPPVDTLGRFGPSSMLELKLKNEETPRLPGQPAPPAKIAPPPDNTVGPRPLPPIG